MIRPRDVKHGPPGNLASLFIPKLRTPVTNWELRSGSPQILGKGRKKGNG